MADGYAAVPYHSDEENDKALNPSSASPGQSGRLTIPWPGDEPKLHLLADTAEDELCLGVPETIALPPRKTSAPTPAASSPPAATTVELTDSSVAYVGYDATFNEAGWGPGRPPKTRPAPPGLDSPLRPAPHGRHASPMRAVPLLTEAETDGLQHRAAASTPVCDEDDQSKGSGSSLYSASAQDEEVQKMLRGKARRAGSPNGLSPSLNPLFRSGTPLGGGVSTEPQNRTSLSGSASPFSKPTTPLDQAGFEAVEQQRGESEALAARLTIGARVMTHKRGHGLVQEVGRDEITIRFD